MCGSLDLDKMEYLRRDARFCGVPYGEVDVDRLIQGLVLLPDPESGLYEVGVHEKAVASLESLLFAKYQMFRNVYWHHGVRAATALYKRIVEEAVAEGLGDAGGPGGAHRRRTPLRDQPEGRGSGHARSRAPDEPGGFRHLRSRRIPKTGPGTHGGGPGRNPSSRLAWDRLSPEAGAGGPAGPRSLDLEPGEVVVDYPVKAAMFQLNLLLERRNGGVARVGPEGLPGVIDLPRVAEELYRTARVLRVFTFPRRTVTREAFLIGAPHRERNRAGNLPAEIGV